MADCTGRSKGPSSYELLYREHTSSTVPALRISLHEREKYEIVRETCGPYETRERDERYLPTGSVAWEWEYGDVRVYTKVKHEGEESWGEREETWQDYRHICATC